MNPNSPDRVVVAYSDGRPPLRARDLIRDNEQTMCREYMGLDGKVHTWVSVKEIEHRGSRHERWGTYADIDDRRILCGAT